MFPDEAVQPEPENTVDQSVRNRRAALRVGCSSSRQGRVRLDPAISPCCSRVIGGILRTFPSQVRPPNPAPLTQEEGRAVFALPASCSGSRTRIGVPWSSLSATMRIRRRRGPRHLGEAITIERMSKRSEHRDQRSGRGRSQFGCATPRLGAAPGRATPNVTFFTAKTSNQ